MKVMLVFMLCRHAQLRTTINVTDREEPRSVAAPGPRAASGQAAVSKEPTSAGSPRLRLHYLSATEQPPPSSDRNGTGRCACPGSHQAATSRPVGQAAGEPRRARHLSAGA